MTIKNDIEVIEVDAVICCPAEHAEAGRQIASAYMQSLNVVDWQPENMLPLSLSPTGELPATHFACSQKCHKDDFEAMEAWIANAQGSYLEIKETTLWSFLNSAGLKVIS